MKKCYNCKEIVNRPPSHTKSKIIFCSVHCYRDALSKDYTLHPSYKGAKRDYVCASCGKSFTRRAKKNYIPKYCSLKCSAKNNGEKHNGEKHWNWKGGLDIRYLKKKAPRPRPELCEICGQKGKKRNGIVFDHDHKTMKFRGWLCSNCNTVLGLVNEDIKKLKLIINYLNEKSGELLER